MAVTNGQPANQTTFNNAFLSRTVDSTTIGVIGLLNSAPASGSSVTNIQREFNSLASFLGKALNTVFNALPTWPTSNLGTGTDDIFERVQAIDAAFDGATGHTHDGTDGNGPLIDAEDIASTVLHGYFQRATDLSAITGTSTDVSTELTGKTPSSGSTVKGVVVTAPYNKIILRDNTAANQGDDLLSSLGDIVYGRLTESAGTWTLSFYTNIAGIETAYSFSAAEIQWYYQELFNPITDAPVYSEEAFLPSDNATQDVIDATSTLRGLINATTQSLGGVKTWVAGQIHQAYLALNRFDVASAGSPFASLSTSKSFVKLTGTTAATVDGAVAGTDGQVLVLYNGTNQDATVVHESGSAGSASQRFFLAGATDMTVTAGSSAVFIYDTGQSRWAPAASGSGSGGGALQVTGSRASPQNITAGGGIAFTGTDARQLWFIQGDGAAVDVSANPQIAAATTVGQELVLVGRHDTNTVYLENGTGLSLNGPATLGEDDVLNLVWDGTNWTETSRNV